jgi:hypothetical protein
MIWSAIVPPCRSARQEKRTNTAAAAAAKHFALLIFMISISTRIYFYHPPRPVSMNRRDNRSRRGFPQKILMKINNLWKLKDIEKKSSGN